VANEDAVFIHRTSGGLKVADTDSSNVSLHGDLGLKCDGLYEQGWQPRIIWIGLGGCVFFTALEEAKKFYLPKDALVEQNKH
jgi:hypothetical protein